MSTLRRSVGTDPSFCLQAQNHFAKPMSTPDMCMRLVPSLIWGLQVVQGLRVVQVFLYRYSMKISLKKARSPGTTEGGRSD